jgi:hypothetical protein
VDRSQKIDKTVRSIIFCFIFYGVSYGVPLLISTVSYISIFCYCQRVFYTGDYVQQKSTFNTVVFLPTVHGKDNVRIVVKI